MNNSATNSQAEAAPAPVKGVLDVQGRLIEADPQLADFHRRSGGQPGDILAIPQIVALARLARKMGIVVSRPALAADGEHDLDLWVRAEPSADKVLLAISGWRKRPRYVPVESRPGEREMDFFRAAADWVWETDRSLNISALSPTAVAVINRPVSELSGRPLTSLFHFCENSDGSLPILHALAERRRFEGQFAEIRGGNGDRYCLEGAPLIDSAGIFNGFRGIAVNISANMREATAAQDEAHGPLNPVVSAAFGERLDKALREPLDHIITHAEAIGAQKEGPLLDKYADYATDISSAGRHLVSLVQDLVDFQAIEQPGFTPVAEAIDLAKIAREVAQLLVTRAVEKQVRIEVPKESTLLPATGEYRRALQIITNLVTNAIRYSPTGGIVRILVGRSDSHAVVSVIDQGKGIDPADQARIFEKFERVDPSEPGGTGLGLYISRRLARAMGGDVICQSKPGEGAQFTLILPVR